MPLTLQFIKKYMVKIYILIVKKSKIFKQSRDEVGEYFRLFQENTVHDTTAVALVNGLCICL